MILHPPPQAQATQAQTQEDGELADRRERISQRYGSLRLHLKSVVSSCAHFGRHGGIEEIRRAYYDDDADDNDEDSEFYPDEEDYGTHQIAERVIYFHVPYDMFHGIVRKIEVALRAQGPLIRLRLAGIRNIFAENHGYISRAASMGVDLAVAENQSNSMPPTPAQTPMQIAQSNLLNQLPPLPAESAEFVTKFVPMTLSLVSDMVVEFDNVDDVLRVLDVVHNYAMFDLK